MGTVLVADDDPLIRLVLNEALERRGHRVVEAVDAVDVLRVAEGEHVDLCLMDAGMPGPSLGVRIDAIRRSQPRTPIVVLSGLAECPDSECRPDVGFLRKPLELGRLDIVLRDAGLAEGLT